MTERNRRKVNLLDEVLERRMLLYVLAAGATLSGASTVQAKVVFTPSNAVLTQYNTLQIDMNNDGVVDLSLSDHGNYKYYSCSTNGKRVLNKALNPGLCRYPISYMEAFEGQSNFAEVEILASGAAAALRGGAIIRAGDEFTAQGQVAFLESGRSDSAGKSWPFANVTNRFLGVRFVINGQVHFGWIGFRSVTNKFVATLAGWAYETEPNKPIRAGDRGKEESSQMQSAEPTSLQLLAMGHTGIADRQRRIAAQTAG